MQNLYRFYTSGVEVPAASNFPEVLKKREEPDKVESPLDQLRKFAADNGARLTVVEVDQRPRYVTGEFPVKRHPLEGHTSEIPEVCRAVIADIAGRPDNSSLPSLPAHQEKLIAVKSRAAALQGGVLITLLRQESEAQLDLADIDMRIEPQGAVVATRHFTVSPTDDSPEGAFRLGEVLFPVFGAGKNPLAYVREYDCSSSLTERRSFAPEAVAGMVVPLKRLLEDQLCTGRITAQIVWSGESSGLSIELSGGISTWIAQENLAVEHHLQLQGDLLKRLKEGRFSQPYVTERPQMSLQPGGISVDSEAEVRVLLEKWCQSPLGCENANMQLVNASILAPAFMQDSRQRLRGAVVKALDSVMSDISAALQSKGFYRRDFDKYRTCSPLDKMSLFVESIGDRLVVHLTKHDEHVLITRYGDDTLKTGVVGGNVTFCLASNPDTTKPTLVPVRDFEQPIRTAAQAAGISDINFNGLFFTFNVGGQVIEVRPRIQSTGLRDTLVDINAVTQPNTGYCYCIESGGQPIPFEVGVAAKSRYQNGTSLPTLIACEGQLKTFCQQLTEALSNPK